MRVQRYKNALRRRLVRRGLPEPLHQGSLNVAVSGLVMPSVYDQSN